MSVFIEESNKLNGCAIKWLCSSFVRRDQLHTGCAIFIKILYCINLVLYQGYTWTNSNSLICNETTQYKTLHILRLHKKDTKLYTCLHVVMMVVASLLTQRGSLNPYVRHIKTQLIKKIVFEIEICKTSLHKNTHTHRKTTYIKIHGMQHIRYGAYIEYLMRYYHGVNFQHKRREKSLYNIYRFQEKFLQPHLF